MGVWGTAADLARESSVTAAPALQAQTTVGNVRAAQRAGTKRVDIESDVAGTATPVTVSLAISPAEHPVDRAGGVERQMQQAILGVSGSAIEPHAEVAVRMGGEERVQTLERPGGPGFHLDGHDL